MADLAADPIVSATDASAKPEQAPRAAQRDATRHQIKQLAQEFEAMLMTQMLREMRKSMLDDDRSDAGFGTEAMTDTIDVELGRALSQTGGLGLSTVLLRSIERQILGTAPAAAGATSSPAVEPAPEPPPASPLAPAVAAPSPVPPPEAAPEPSGAEALQLPTGAVTSAYGWRRDPFTGHARFHRGVDLAMAYGKEVQAAGDGRVVFSGEARGYGQMVVIEHLSGQQTRYAHLSAASVQQGDTVRAGQVVGRVGQSGRATGPHLHFEVIDQGHAIDPRGNHDAD